MTLFTRLPFWRLRRVPPEAFADATAWWPAAGWLTGGLTALTLWGAACCFPMPLAVVLAFAVRVLLTGALHEDGLADCCDGFGGGTSPEKRLAIMKDSHVGTYGLLGLLFYALLLTQTVAALPLSTALRAIAAGDPLAKLLAAQLTNALPYVRPLAQSKVGAYRRMDFSRLAVALFFGALPFFVLLPLRCGWALLPPMLLTAGMTGYLRRKIGGYTGDCCGAAFLLNELAFYLSLLALTYGNLVG